MMGCDVHLLVQVKSVSPMPLDSRVQVHLFTSGVPRSVDYPVEEAAPKFLSLPIGTGDQVVHIQGASPRQKLGNSEPGQRPHRASVRQKRELISGLFLLAEHPFEEARLGKMRAQFGHRWETALNGCLVLSQTDLELRAVHAPSFYDRRHLSAFLQSGFSCEGGPGADSICQALPASLYI